MTGDGAARYEALAELFSRDGRSSPPHGDVQDVGAAFDLVEDEFGRYLDEGLAPRGPESLYELIAEAAPPAGAIAVDVGCGDGRDSVQLARRFGLHVHAIDPYEMNVDAARARAASEGVSGVVEPRVGGAESIPLAGDSVDVLWCKEVLTFTDLDSAAGEFARVLRPSGFGVVYQVITGPAMSDAEAAWFHSHELGFGAARSLRPADVEAAFSRAALVVRRRVDYASEWGEAAEERSGAAGRRLLHAARLLRDPARYIDRFGETNYRIMFVDCLWHVYRMIGKLWGVAFVIERQGDR